MKLRLQPSRFAKTCPRRWRETLAFTLVEVLLAMGIFAFVLTAIYSSWSSVMRGTRSAQVAAAAVQRSRVAVRAVEEALLTAQIFNGNPQHYWFVADTKGEFGSLDMVSRLPDTFPGSGMYGEQMLRHVTFTVERSDDGENQLILRQWPLLMPVNRGGPDCKPYTIVLGRFVDLFKLDFFDFEKKEWIDEWKYTNQFPKLVRVAVGMSNKKDLPVEDHEIITRIIAPAAMMVPREFQMPGGMPGAPPPPQPGQPGQPLPPQPMPIR